MSNALSETGVKNLIQLSMDGPHVNWKAFGLLQKELQKQVDRFLLKIGSCGLHMIHITYREGCKATCWDIQHTLEPVHHQNFIGATGCSTVMLKFCRHRWLENVSVSNRALKLWSYVQIHVERGLRGELPDPKTKNSTKDSLFIPKVMIFNSIVREITSFLSEDVLQLMKGRDSHFILYFWLLSEDNI